MILAIVVASTLTLGSPGVASATIPPGNLVVNGGAEVGPSSEVGDRHPIPGWTTIGGASGFMAVDYREPDDPSPRLHNDDPETSGCRAFFGGGEGVGSTTSAAQTIDVSAAAAEIDGGSVLVKVGAAVGQAPGGEDQAEVRIEFLKGSGSSLGGFSFTSLPATTQLNSGSGSATLAVGVRRIRVEVKAIPGGGSSNLAYADNIGVTLDGSSPTAPAPAGCNGGIALTGLASNITETTATLVGTVEPNLDLTRYHFEYGPTTAYGSSSSTGETGSVTAPVPVSTTLTGLTPGTIYHYRLVAESPRPLGLGTFYGAPSRGANGTFLTAGNPPSHKRLTRSLSLRYAAKRTRFSGMIRSSDHDCLRGKVKVYRAQKGRDPKVTSDRAGANGKWSAGEDAKNGRYYAVAGKRTAGATLCPSVKSAIVTVG